MNSIFFSILQDGGDGSRRNPLRSACATLNNREVGGLEELTTYQTKNKKTLRSLHEIEKLSRIIGCVSCDCEVELME